MNKDKGGLITLLEKSVNANVNQHREVGGVQIKKTTPCCANDPDCNKLSCEIHGFGIKSETVEPNSLLIPDDCPCYCGEEDCGWKGIISDCEIAIDSEGWEYPEYEVLVCPKCGEYSIIL